MSVVAPLVVMPRERWGRKEGRRDQAKERRREGGRKGVGWGGGVGGGGRVRERMGRTEREREGEKGCD